MRKPTRANVSALFDALREQGMPIVSVPSVDVPHLKRCIEFGLLMPDPNGSKGWVLTPSGYEALREPAAVKRHYPKGTVFHPKFVAIMGTMGHSGPGFTAENDYWASREQPVAKVIPFPVRRNAAERWSRYNGKCKKCGTVTSGLSLGDEARRLETDPKHGPVFDDGRGNFVMRCRGCRAFVRAEYVRGKYNPHIECSAKCINATGKVCECSCGGKNHGAGFSA